MVKSNVQQQSPITGEYRLVSLSTVDAVLNTALRAVIYLEDLQGEGASKIVTKDEFRSCQRGLHDAVKALVADMG